MIILGEGARCPFDEIVVRGEGILVFLKSFFDVRAIFSALLFKLRRTQGGHWVLSVAVGWRFW